MIIDLHTHTYPTSEDSTLTPERLIAESKRVGLDGICITDHDGFWDPGDIKRLSEAHDFLVIPGCEVTTEEGHILVYGLTEYIFGMHRAAFVKALLDETGGAMVIAHPYRRSYRAEAERDVLAYQEMLEKATSSALFSISDAVEVFNGRGTLNENTFSHEIASRLSLFGTGASDAHSLADIGTYATEFYRTVSGIDDLITELKAGRYRPVAMGRTKKHS